MIDELWQKALKWWRNAPSRKRWSAITVAFGVLCTGLFIIFTNSYQPASTTVPSAVEKMDNPGYYFGVIAKTVGVLLLIIGGAVVLKRTQKKHNGFHSDRALAVTETIRLSPKQALHLVRVGEQYFLVGATDQNLNLISRVNPGKAETEEIQEQADQKQSFEAVLADVSVTQKSILPVKF